MIYTNIGELPLPDGIDNDNNGYIDDIQGWDAAENDNNPNPPAPLPPGLNFPKFSHGTHVAALAGASTNNNAIGIASIGYGVKLIPVKIGLDANAVLSNVFKGVEYAVAAGADVINMSWGAYVYDITLEKMMNDIRARGIILVAAAGNDEAITPMYPASYPAVISVGATNSTDVRASFSNYNTSIDVMAPGEGIYSAIYQPSSTALYGNFNGTSMASPIVAGLCGLMLSYNPNLTPAALESCLKTNCDNIDAQNSGKIGMLGAGRINAEKTMKCLQTAPVAEFTSNFQTICVGQQIRFVCKFFSGEENATYSWSFPGANTLTSTDANPAITYSTPGVYSVSVVITNAFGSTTLTKTNYITVKSARDNYNYGVKVDNNWFMHNGLALKFPQSSVANPQFIVEGSQFPRVGEVGEGCASISNYDGQPLFYSNGLSVFNRHHEVMSNGYGLGSVNFGPISPKISSISQNTLIVPDPNECSSKYYLFHLTPDALLYSVIDMDEDNGLGAVIQKNETVGNPFQAAEYLTAIMHCDGESVWVIAHDMSGNEFRAHLVTKKNGVSSTTKLSNVGFANNNKEGGQMKGSPSGYQIALASREGSQICDFDRGTGDVSNAIEFKDSDGNLGIEFSADGSKIYIAGGKLVQYDLTGFTRFTPYVEIASEAAPNWGYGGTLELGPDGKIYASKTVSTLNRYTKLDVINTPNQKQGGTTACDLIRDGMPIANPNGTNFQWGMNNSFISKTLNYHGQIKQISYNKVICNGGSVTLDPGDAGPGATYSWENGPNFRTKVVNTAGDYTVTITNPSTSCKTKVVFVVRNETAVINLGPDRTVNKCDDIAILLDAGIGFDSYEWSTGETGSSITANAFGLYWVEGTTSGRCKSRDTIYISPFGSPPQSVTRIYYTCGSPGIDLDALNINTCPGNKTPWLLGTGNDPAPNIVEPTGNMSLRREVTDANGCVYCVEVIEIIFNPVSIEYTTLSFACEGDNVGITPAFNPPCNTANLWEYFYPDGTSWSTTDPISLSVPAKNGDVYKIRSRLPNGCYCESITNVTVIGPKIKKKTITIDCGASVNLEDYSINECPNNTNYTWGETLDSRLSSSVVSPKQTKTYFRQSYDMVPCLDCILELTVEVKMPIAASHIIEVDCGTVLDMETIGGCNGLSGLPGTFYWHDGLQVLDPPTSVFTVTGNKTYYRESLNGCPCPSSVTVRTINPAPVTVNIPEDHCFGKVFNFVPLCEKAGIYTSYQLIDPNGIVIATSSTPIFSKELFKKGNYKVLAISEYGCTCTTIYNSKVSIPQQVYTRKERIWLCPQMPEFNPLPECPNAAYYKWVSSDYSRSFLSQDGSITFTNTLQLIVPGDYEGYITRLSYDANGCVICIERYLVGKQLTTYNERTISHEIVGICDNTCHTFDPSVAKFFPLLQPCQLTLLSLPSPRVNSITYNANGTITICVNTIPTNRINLTFSCPFEPCSLRVTIGIARGTGCKKGADVSIVEETVISDYNINIFPNPTTGMVTLDMKGSAGIVKNIQVFDVLGRRVLTASVTEEQKEFNLSEFTKGIYTIRVETDEKVHTQKVVLK